MLPSSIVALPRKAILWVKQILRQCFVMSTEACGRTTKKPFGSTRLRLARTIPQHCQVWGGCTSKVALEGLRTNPRQDGSTKRQPK